MKNDKWNPPAYELVAKSQYQDGMKLIELVNPRDGENILEIGCGPGRHTIELAKRTPTGFVFALDASPKMIDFAKKKIMETGIKNVKFLIQDIQQIDIVSFFDVIFSSSVLHWIPDQENLLNLLKRALKKEGRLGIMICAKDSFHEGTIAAEKIISKIGLKKCYTNWIWPCLYPQKEEYEILLKKVGFSNVKVELEEYEIWFKTGEEAITFHKESGLHSYLANLSEREREKFLEEYRIELELLKTPRGVKSTVKAIFATAGKGV
ncbi:MAG: methyltransferase domain-containing protein [Candidatus Firestonebacteria bacterium]|nr:methyltransferase domain-containing protein [Candidatus Firestonebacteria bacterium]